MGETSNKLLDLNMNRYKANRRNIIPEHNGNVEIFLKAIWEMCHKIIRFYK